MTVPYKDSAVFLDRDGTLIEDRGHLRSPTQVEFFPDTVRALRLLRWRFRLFIVTNQPGIAEGTVLSAEAAQVNDHVVRHLAKDGSDEITRAAEVLRNGGVVAFPTETVYGLGANAFDPKAVARIFEIKRRPRFDPLIVHVSDIQQTGQVVSDFPNKARALADRFWPGPLTLVLPKDNRVPDIVTSGLQAVAVRMPDHPLALALIRQAGTPVAAPSANPFGRTSPTTADHVRKQLDRDVDLVLDGGPCRVGVESTILSLAEDRPTLLRAGGLPMEEIEEVIGRVFRPDSTLGRPSAPGQLPRHYAPRTPLVLRSEPRQPPGDVRAGLLSFRSPANLEGFTAVEVLSPDGDLREAAANLFAALHRLDSLDLDVIVADAVPDMGLGLAINDRLCRAARGTRNEVLRRYSS